MIYKKWRHHKHQASCWSESQTTSKIITKHDDDTSFGSHSLFLQINSRWVVWELVLKILACCLLLQCWTGDLWMHHVSAQFLCFRDVKSLSVVLCLPLLSALKNQCKHQFITVHDNNCSLQHTYMQIHTHTHTHTNPFKLEKWWILLCKICTSKTWLPHHTQYISVQQRKPPQDYLS